MKYLVFGDVSAKSATSAQYETPLKTRQKSGVSLAYERNSTGLYTKSLDYRPCAIAPKCGRASPLLGQTPEQGRFHVEHPHD